MPFNGSGVFSIVNTFVPNTTILSAAVNQNFSDIATGLSDCLTRDGQAGMTAALAMGNNKITGMADPSVSTDGATKNYVDTQFNTAWSTGDVKLTVKTVADSGWLLFADQTIGNVGSGATYANANALALYTLLWNNISSPTSNAFAPVTGGLGASAAADWAGLKPMLLLKTLGRALALSGAGSGLTSRALGSNVGGETQTLITANLPPYTPSGSVSVNSGAAFGGNTGGGTVVNVGSNNTVPLGNASLTAAFTGSAQGGTSTAFSIMQPSTFLNAMIKL